MILSVILSFVLLNNCSKDETTNTPIGVEDYVVFAWNDLGMHCLNPSYDKLVILPPYNTVWAQVIKRGQIPEIITSGITVEYSLLNNSYSYGKREYSGFWDNINELFGLSSLDHDVGLTGNGLSGTMHIDDDHFVTDGIPVVPVNDNDVWNPYQVMEITIKDINGNTLVTTQTTVPTSDEINCAKCHGVNAFDDILTKHDAEHGTNLVSSKPVLCASCHGSPALGTTGEGSSGKYLSEAIHGSHADKAGIGCYDCHPGTNTQCSRSTAHTSSNGNCTTCHGEMSNVASTIESGRVPWVTEPACSNCHTGVSGVSTGTNLYRNSKGHGNVYCAACHGSPHAMIPSNQASDNYQALQYQGFTGKVKTIGSCGVCHNSSRGDGASEFSEEHGGTNPERSTGCNVCHTSTPTNSAEWPHAYQWTNSND